MALILSFLFYKCSVRWAVMIQLMLLFILGILGKVHSEPRQMSFASAGPCKLPAKNIPMLGIKQSPKTVEPTRV